VARTPRTKIIATLGPVSSNYTMLRKMMIASLNVVRLNFSHGNYESHLQTLSIVRSLNKKYRRRICVMQDLEGFRIRVGYFENSESMIVETNKTVWLHNSLHAAGTKTIPFDYDGPLSSFKPGHSIFIDDGKILLRVISAGEKSIKAKVIEGGLIKQRKGINLPDTKLEFGAFTQKDRDNVEFAVEHKLDYIALSFVRDADDVLEASEYIKSRLPKCKIISKIENGSAISTIDQIIKVSDAIMIARGDMGIAIPIQDVPIVQKYLIKKCNEAGKPVITATQMLEHMTEYTRPTRAEVTDVANAILDGTDYVMLSGETAVGKHPDLCVWTMNEIIKATEAYQRTNEVPNRYFAKQ